MPQDQTPKKPKGVFATDEQRAVAGRASSVVRPRARETSGEIMVPAKQRPIEYDDEPTPRPVSLPLAVDKLWDETREDVRELQTLATSHGNRLIAIAGEDGTNGKVGVLTSRVDGLTSKAWWVISTVLGGLAAAAVKLIIVVRAFDAVEAKAEHNAQRIELLQAQQLSLQAQVQTLQAAILAKRRFDLDQLDSRIPQ